MGIGGANNAVVIPPFGGVNSRRLAAYRRQRLATISCYMAVISRTLAPGGWRTSSNIFRTKFLICVAIAATFVFQSWGIAAAPTSAETSTAPAQLTFEQDGRTYAIVNGDVYEVTSTGQRIFVDRLYDPDFFAKNFVIKSGVVYRVDPDSGTLYGVTRTFRDSFEGVASVDGLMTLTRWHTNTADEARTADQYNYYGLGNRVAISKQVVRKGKASLRCYAVPSSRDVSKASLSKGLMYYKKGDTVHFSGLFFIEPTPSIYDGGGFTLFDLESTFFTGSVGMRVIFQPNDALAFELKLPKIQYTQNKGAEVRFPTGRWVRIETRVLLSDDAGRVQIWQDGRLVLDKQGRTLPLADTVYDRFEAGISAIAQGSRYEKVVYMDDVVISDAPITY
jgi:hypothetical protein